MVKKFTQEMLPLFNEIVPEKIASTMTNLMNKNREKLANLLAANETFTWDNLMQPIEDMNDELHKTWSPISHLHSVMETDALREAYHEVLPLLTEYHTEIAQNEKLFNAISSIENHIDFPKLSDAQRKIIENEIRDFKLSGIHLSAEKKSRFATLQIELNQLMTKFSENVLDATHGFTLHITDEKMIEGLPDQTIQLIKENAKQKGLSGYLFTLDFPCYSSSIRFLKNRELRKTLFEAYNTRASDQGPNANRWDNTRIIEDILLKRSELAELVGFENYAEYSLATKMAKTPDEVLHFLDDLVIRSKPIAEKEYAEVKALAQKVDGLIEVESWDISYYSEKLREATFNFSQEALREYFPIDKSLEGLFLLMKKIFNVSIVEENHFQVWHPHVKFFAIYDEKNGLCGGVYIDLYARSHKRDGAWMDDCRIRRRLSENQLQYPVAYLTCNFMPPIDSQPALLTHDDILTLFHEFGHCMHHILTKIDYPSVAGINGVPWDAVEFPSQFLENFCWEKELLNAITKHVKTGESLPDDLYNKMLLAKNFQAGLQMIRQLEFSLFDFKLHLKFNPKLTNEIQAQKILDEVRDQICIIPSPPFKRFQHSFSHIFGGSYAAGYYSYKWAEVLSADAYSKFEEQGIFNTETGISFKQNILEVGGVRDPMTAFIAFRGRPPKIEALLKHNGMM